MPSSTVLGQSLTVPTAAAVYLHPFYAIAIGGSRATTAIHTIGVPVVQLQEGWALHPGLPSAETGQLTTYCSAHGEPAEGPSTTV
jgi:hypothetical protein